MSFYDVVQSFQSIDDSTVSVLAMLIGIVGGWTITNMRQKMKAERIKAEKRHAQLRNRDDR